MADQLPLLLDAFRRGRRVRSKATGKEGTISGTAIRSRVVRGKSQMILLVAIRRDDGSEAQVAHWTQDVLDQEGNPIA